MPAMSLDEDKRRDSRREDAHLGQRTSTLCATARD